MRKTDIEYRFRQGGQAIAAITVDLDATGRAPAPEEPGPAWAALGFQQCPNCPLNVEREAECPFARRLAAPLKTLGRLLSYDEIDVEVITAERSVSQRTSAQRAVSSFMGLVAAASGCPHTAYFRPMARFHLPFASEDETLYRAASMYTLAQYFRQQSGQPADLELEGLVDIYRQVQTVNRAMSVRLRAAFPADAPVNALILLDMFAKAMPYAVEDRLEAMRPLFGAYLAPESPGAADPA